MHPVRYLSACALLSLGLAAAWVAAPRRRHRRSPITARAPRRSVGAPAWTRAPTRPTAAACGNACPDGEVCAGGLRHHLRPGPDPLHRHRRDRPLPRHWRRTRRTAAPAATPAPLRRTPTGPAPAANAATSAPAGYADCDGAAPTVARPTSTNDPENCGACGHVCPTGPGQVGTCTQGTCGVTCAPGHADCNGDPADGCEVDTATDPGNCGACGTTCTTAGPRPEPRVQRRPVHRHLRHRLRGLQRQRQRRVRDAAGHPDRLHHLRGQLRCGGQSVADL